MSETKFTPGPWNLRESYTLWDTKSFLVDIHPFHSIAEVRNGAEDEEYGGEPRLIANAHLIAAAPEMLQVLEDVLDALTDGGAEVFLPGQNDYHVGAIKRVLKKALNEDSK